MFRIIYTNKFEKDVVRCTKTGLDLYLLEELVNDLKETGSVSVRISCKESSRGYGNAILKLTGYYFGSKTKITKQLPW